MHIFLHCLLFKVLIWVCSYKQMQTQICLLEARILFVIILNIFFYTSWYLINFTYLELQTANSTNY